MIFGEEIKDKAGNGESGLKCKKMSKQDIKPLRSTEQRKLCEKKHVASIIKEESPLNNHTEVVECEDSEEDVEKIYRFGTGNEPAENQEIGLEDFMDNYAENKLCKNLLLNRFMEKNKKVLLDPGSFKCDCGSSDFTDISENELPPFSYRCKSKKS